MNDWKLIDEKNQEIAELKSLAAYAEQRANMLQKANDSLVLKNASLNSQAVNQVELHNKVVFENNELKAMVKTLRDAAIFTDKEFRHHANVESFETTVLSEALAKTRG